MSYIFTCMYPSTPGHYWYDQKGQRSNGPFPAAEVDGKFVLPARIGQGVARLSFYNNYTILAFHDYTCDKRPGSNTAILVYDHVHVDVILEEFCKHWPEKAALVMKAGGIKL